MVHQPPGRRVPTEPTSAIVVPRDRVTSMVARRLWRIPGTCFACSQNEPQSEHSLVFVRARQCHYGGLASKLSLTPMESADVPRPASANVWPIVLM